MGLTSKTVIIRWSNTNRKQYEIKGYVFTKMRNEFEVKVEDIIIGSDVKVEVKCDCKECKNPQLYVKWRNYLKCVKEDGKYYCNSCAMKLYGNETRTKNKLSRGKSFAQWGIDNICEDFLEKYWDYEKNSELGIDPWNITYSCATKVWIKCQEKDYHIYIVRCSDFVRKDRCPYCSNNRGKVHPLDSLGTSHPEVLKTWSDKNKKSAFEYAPKSNQKVWWKCECGKHEDYFRTISDSNTCEFRCPNCGFSKGEKRIEECLIKNSIDYTPQKEFEGLIGLNKGNLSYDFYLPQYNLLIEYQGGQHEKYTKGIHQTKKDFEKQVQHDKRKREYAKQNNINLLEIWYWDFDNVKKILEKELKC